MWFSGGFAAIGSSLIAALSIRSSFFYSHNRVTQCVCFSSPAQDDVVIGGIRAGEVTVGDVSCASLSLDGLMWGNVTLVVCGAPCCRLVPSVSGDVSLFVLRFFCFSASVSTCALIISSPSRFLVCLIPSPCCVIAPTFSAWSSEWRECDLIKTTYGLVLVHLVINL